MRGRWGDGCFLFATLQAGRAFRKCTENVCCEGSTHFPSFHPVFPHVRGLTAWVLRSPARLGSVGRDGSHRTDEKGKAHGSAAAASPRPGRKESLPGRSGGACPAGSETGAMAATPGALMLASVGQRLPTSWLSTKNQLLLPRAPASQAVWRSSLPWRPRHRVAPEAAARGRRTPV